MPNIKGLLHQGEYLLEAQEPQQTVPFPRTAIGRLPPEIRARIYIAALKYKTVEIESRLSYSRKRMN